MTTPSSLACGICTGGLWPPRRTRACSPRPTVEGDPRYPVRRPATSSFPSGHASAAAFTATLLTGWDGRRTTPLWWGLAVTVASSRAFVRIHHPSDVVAGMATGAVLGLAARRVLRAVGMR